MLTFERYVAGLEALAEAALRGKGHLDPRRVAAALDGDVARVFRSTVTASQRKRTGAFFTGETIARSAVARWRSVNLCRGRIYDPAVGTGDLLLPIAAKLGCDRSLPATLERWSDKLSGCDINSVLVRAARARLVLAATVVSGRRPVQRRASLDALFPMLECASGLADNAVLRTASHVVLNPPFVPGRVADDCRWATGRRSLAAVFLDHVLQSAAPGTRVSAVLPDSLRIGPQYRHWRAAVLSRGRDVCALPLGAFADADVHVFLLRLIVGIERPGASSDPWHWPTRISNAGNALGDRCHVRVGPYVPHRDRAGNWHPLLDVSHAPPGGCAERTAPRRRFTGPFERPPFVVVRRTSSPHDHKRVVATLVHRGAPRIVENHLLIIRPREGGVAACKEVMRVLDDPRTDPWINDRTGCRHLTVGVIRDLPWWPDAQ
jgi:hypothetical protein